MRALQRDHANIHVKVASMKTHSRTTDPSISDSMSAMTLHGMESRRPHAQLTAQPGCCITCGKRLALRVGNGITAGLVFCMDTGGSNIRTSHSTLRCTGYVTYHAICTSSHILGDTLPLTTTTACLCFAAREQSGDSRRCWCSGLISRTISF